MSMNEGNENEAASDEEEDISLSTLEMEGQHNVILKASTGEIVHNVLY